MSGGGSAAGSIMGRDSIEMGTSNQELVRSKEFNGKCSKKALWLTGALTAGIIIIVVIVVLVTELTDDPNAQPVVSNGFELDDYLNGRFNYKRFNGTWINGNEFMYRDKTGNLLKYDVIANSNSTILSTANAPLLEQSFLQQLSADGKFVLLGYAYEKLFRHSYIANYSVIDVETYAETPLIAPDGTQRLMLVKWSTVGNALIMVHENNIYYKDTADGTSMPEVTSNGSPNKIYNGVPDWVYEEEVFGSNEAAWFSPDGKRLAYCTFDDTNVRTMSYPWYGEANNFVYQYPLTVSIKYPKPGTNNPIVKLSTIDLVKLVAGDRVAIPIKPPSQVGSDHILAAVTWSKENEISSVWMNRVQYLFVLTANQADNGNPEIVMEKSESAGWVEMFTPPEFSSDGMKMLTILPQPQADSGDYRHVTLVQRNAGGSSVQTAVTKGNFVVTRIAAWDQANQRIYYTATNESDPAQQHLFSIDELGATTPECLSCGVKITPERQVCTHASASFSTDLSHYVLTCNGPDIPGVLIVKQDTTVVRLWEDNADLAAFMAAHSAPSRRRMFVDVAGNMKAYVQLWLPPGMDESGNTKYPMLINVYGGPDSVQVSDRWVGDWGTYLTTNRSFIYGAIDGRGSGLKGNNVLFAGFRHLGTVEIEDQINVTKHLQDMLPYIDKTRTSIWGWSYGGYSTGMALAKDLTGVFKCGMSVAPVTDWIYYDSIYTERYMGLPVPNDNLQGYYEANLNNFVDNLGRNIDRYLLVHGNADDNVHYQQSMILSRTLELKDILFRQQSYPDEAHGLNGVSPHLYHTLENFLDECLNVTRPAT